MGRLDSEAGVISSEKDLRRHLEGGIVYEGTEIISIGGGGTLKGIIF